MSARIRSLFRSMPLRLAFGLVLLFSSVSLISFAASYVLTKRSFEQTIRDDLRQDIAGFRAAPNALALAQLVEAESQETDPERLALSYLAPNRRQYGNAFIGRDSEGYHVLSLSQDSPNLSGSYLSLTTALHGGQLTIARSLSDIAALRRAFLNVLGLSLFPTILIAMSGGLFLARRSTVNVKIIGNTLDQLTAGNLKSRVNPTPDWSEDLAGIGEKIDQMARAQESSVAAIRQVSSDIAHDLKTPIQRVAVHLEDLSNQHDLRPEAVELVTNAKTELDGVSSVFRSLLQIAQIESGSPASSFVPVDLSEIIKTCTELYDPAINDSGHKLISNITPDDYRVLGDRNLLLQMLANLIENALHHTPEGSEIAIGLSHKDDRILLSVSDNGPGIPENEMQNVLMRLYRLDRSRNTPGSGLGLSLVSVVARIHSAELKLEDNDPGLRISMEFAASSKS